MRPLFLTQTVAAVGLALDGAAVHGRIAVIDWPRLGRQLAERQRQVVQVSPRLRSLRKQRGPCVYAAPAALPFAAGSLAAVVCMGLGDHDDWQAQLAEYVRVLADGGAVVMVDRVVATEMTRRALCGGLAEIEQRSAGRTVVTSGRWFDLAASLDLHLAAGARVRDPS